jgi:hypothetical protein
MCEGGLSVVLAVLFPQSDPSLAEQPGIRSPHKPTEYQKLPFKVHAYREKRLSLPLFLSPSRISGIETTGRRYASPGPTGTGLGTPLSPVDHACLNVSAPQNAACFDSGPRVQSVQYQDMSLSAQSSDVLCHPSWHPRSLFVSWEPSHAMPRLTGHCSCLSSKDMLLAS